MKKRRALRVLLNLVMSSQDAVKSIIHTVEVYIPKLTPSTEKKKASVDIKSSISGKH